MCFQEHQIKVYEIIEIMDISAEQAFYMLIQEWDMSKSLGDGFCVC